MMQPNTSIDTPNIFSVLNSLNSIDNPVETCPTHTSPPNFFLGMFSLWVNGFASVILAGAGVGLNFSGMLYILQKKKTKLFNQIIFFLLIFNTTFLVCKIFTCIEAHLSCWLNLSVWAYLLHPLEHISLLISTWLLTALAHDRYCAVTSPVIHRNLISCSDSRRKRLLQYLVPLITGSVAISLPVFGELKIQQHATSGNDTVLPSSMRLDPYYEIFYVVTLNNILLGILPFCLSTFFYYELSKVPNTEALDECSTGLTQMQLQCRQMKVLNMARKTVISFVLCNSLNIIMNIVAPMAWNAVKPKDTVDPMFCLPIWAHTVEICGKFLIVLANSINVLIYLY